MRCQWRSSLVMLLIHEPWSHDRHSRIALITSGIATAKPLARQLKRPLSTTGKTVGFHPFARGLKNETEALDQPVTSKHQVLI